MTLRPDWLGLRPTWLALGPSRGGTDEQMNEQTNERKISPFYRTLSPIGAAAQKARLEMVLFPPQADFNHKFHAQEGVTLIKGGQWNI